jgi:hypothetical protein
MDKYTFDKCLICGKYKALKDGVCNKCAEDRTLNFFKDLFKKKE